MDRNREARRASSIVGSNGFNRRRHRTNSLRDSPDDDVAPELQETVRLRERVKKDRDRDRERDLRERDRERDLRERDRERDLRSRNKRRRGDDTSEESVNDDEDDEYEENAAAAGSGGVRVLPPPSAAASVSNHHHNHSSSLSQIQHNNSIHNNNNNSSANNHSLQHRKSFPPASSSKVFRPPPVWKSGDEMIGVPVPRKARTASTKRSHDWMSSSSNNNGGGGGGDQILRQPSSSPVRQGLASTSSPAAAPPAPPMSPSSSNVSIRKKLKHGVNNTGPKLKPPKASSKPSSSNPEELEIEIAEVLYGLMTQSQGPSSKKEDSREVNRSSNSSPISNSTSNNNHNPILGSNSTTPLTAVAPKRKRPRPVPDNSSFNPRSSPVLSKPDLDQTPKSEIPSPHLEKKAENGFETGGNSVNSQVPPAARPAEPTPAAQESAPVVEELSSSSNLAVKEEISSPKEKKTITEDINHKATTSIVTASIIATVMKPNSTVVAEIENQRVEKFEIDLMAPPPQGRSSPEKETNTDLRTTVSDQKPFLSILDTELKISKDKEKDDDKGNSSSGKDRFSTNEEKKGKVTVGVEEGESHKAIENNKGRNLDLHLDLEKLERDGSTSGGVNAANGNKLQTQKQHQMPPLKEPLIEKSGQSTSSMPLPMSMASWPGGLPPMGYMAPLQGVVSMDGTTVTPSPIQPFTQPRPKRCATHCHIARNISYLQQFMKMNPFWPAAPASASLFGAKPCNIVPDHVAVRGVNVNNPASHDKGPILAATNTIPNHVSSSVKDKVVSQLPATSDSAQRKHQQQQQILIQQAMPPVASNNLMGPAFIFPLNQQQASMAAAARPTTGKSPTTAAQPTTTTTTSTGGPSAATSAPGGGGGVATAMSFNFPNMAASETQYLAILQNNGYPFPIGAPPPNYRGPPAQAMPLFNGSFYSSQMIHPSQLQNQPSNNNSSSSAQKQHLPGPQQQRPPNGPVGPGSSNMQNFTTQKPQQQSSQQQHVSRNELGSSEESPSAGETRGSRIPAHFYGQNFAMPIHPQNFAMMTAQASGNNNQTEKKSHQQHLKTGPDSLPPHSFAMSFGPMNGNGPVIDMASMAQTHSMFQNSPEASRQMMAAAQAAQAANKKNFRMSEDGKSGGESPAMDDERKNFSGKSSQGGGGGGQSIAFTRSEFSDSPVNSIQANNVIESSARSGQARGPRPVGVMNVQNAHIQAQIQQQQLMQIKQHQQQQQQQQQQQMAAANRSKGPANSSNNGNMYSEHISNMAAKFPNALSGFPQNLIPNNNSNSPSQSQSQSQSQSPQWKNSTANRPGPTSQAQSNSTSVKNLPQQHQQQSSRAQQQQMHTQISFGGNNNNNNQKPSANSSSQAPTNSSNQVGSPTTSSISKGGSPRTTTTTTNSGSNNKTGQASSFSQQQQQPKNPSILGSGAKTQMPHQQSQSQSQQQMAKNMQQAQLFFSNPYNTQLQAQSNSTGSASSGPAGYYMQRRRPEQQGPGGGGPPLSTSTNDPAKAIAAATSNVKGGLPSQGIIHASQFAGQPGGTLLPAGFSYVHPVPAAAAAVQAKPAEQKQPAGNDNMHTWQPDKK